MENELGPSIGSYWVVFYHALPEAGERVAVALVFENHKGPARVEFDDTFAKVRKLYPRVDPQLLAFYLASIRSELNEGGRVKTILDAYGPQFSSSLERQISLPITSRNVDLLMARYIHPEKAARPPRPRRDKVADNIEAFVRSAVGELPLSAHVNASAKEILGRSIAGTKRVALAVPTHSGWTLIDGVDLNQLTPEKVIQRAEGVSRTFWKYNRAAEDMGVAIKRLGVVLNGTSHLEPEAHNAHDYALHRLDTDSDLAIDAASAEAGEQLRDALELVEE